MKRLTPALTLLLLLACGDDTTSTPDSDTTADGADTGADTTTDTTADSADTTADSADTAADTAVDTEADTTADSADTSADTTTDTTADSADTADTTTPPPEADPLFDLIGQVELELRPADEWQPTPETLVGAGFRDGPYVDNYVERARAGQCVLYLNEPNPTCTPECGTDASCQRDNTCVPFPRGASAGPITLTNTTAGSKPITLTVVDDDPNDPWVYYEGRLLQSAWFAPGDAVSVVAAGDDLPAFSATLTGVGPLLVTSGHEVVMGTGKDLELTWTPAGDGSKIEAILNAGWHGRPPDGIIRCRANDADGRITVDQALVAELPYCAGICLFQHNNWIERYSRELIDTPLGPVAAYLFSRFSLYYTEVEAR